MRGTNEEYARGLARIAEHDWRSASIGLAHDAPLDTVCFHLQQAAENCSRRFSWSAIWTIH